MLLFYTNSTFILPPSTSTDCQVGVQSVIIYEISIPALQKLNAETDIQNSIEKIETYT